MKLDYVNNFFGAKLNIFINCEKYADLKEFKEKATLGITA
jgi:hypothetical protein